MVRRGNQCLAALVALVGVGASAQSAAAAPIVSLEHATRTADPGQQASAIVHVAGARSCRLRAGNARRTVVLEGGTRVRYRFAIARAARPGRHTVTVRCDASSVAYRLIVRRGARKANGPLIAGRITALISGRPVEDDEAGREPLDEPAGRGRERRPDPLPSAAPLPPPKTSTDAPDVTRIWLDEVKPLFEARSGECTQWAYEKRPDIVERAERMSIARWLDSRKPEDRYALAMGIASAWADGARAAGLLVDRTPAVGALMVEPGNPGHVAYVEAVGADGLFDVTEMNAPTPGVVSGRTIDTAVIASEGLQFIH